MDAEELAFSGIAAQANLLRARQVSSRELVGVYLDRIEQIDPQINAFIDVFADEALDAAAAADERIASGESAPLLGVPVAIKDELDIAGTVARHGTAGYSQPASTDCVHVARLRTAGAILMGKTHLPELAITGFTESELNGDTRNPWNLTKTPGGSSGGSAAAVAAGLVGAASASDGAGSIRIPAANCGIYGLKPQRGRISLMPEEEHWYGMSKTGCLTRRVLDTALWLDVTAGPAPGDAHTPPPPSLPYVDSARAEPGQLRIAVSTKPQRALVPAIVADEVKEAIGAAAKMLGDFGHNVIEKDPDYGNVANHIITLYLRGVHQHYNQVPHQARLEKRTAGFARLGGLMPERMLRAALAARPRYTDRINRIFGDVDLLVTPVTGELPVEVGKWAGKGAFTTLLGMSRTYPFTAVWNYTGQPAAAVPVGMSATGLPLSVMMIAPSNREDLLLSLGTQMEAAVRWPEQRPPLARE
ncbi:MAG: amidase [Acidimicrobiia bacterium]|nr:amidase [Acidimicrobiia bacterium]